MRQKVIEDVHISFKLNINFKLNVICILYIFHTQSTNLFFKEMNSTLTSFLSKL